ncbi:CHASE2 domain-containing protein [Alteromonas halophila]|uniref:CHASE2 domain-containing protein n=1 Tax=Alteromonas halophila TaxID=516698 RepID=A0A918JML6_9ALTE|nr:CHASE2 domain-containing protein [Alteromonas halophila]GGW87386.1 hypothetical protein GCM10007391_21640 [Alteromonas halophila]
MRAAALVFLILLDPFRITTATDNASADILNRVNALYYSATGQNELAVVLINDDYLTNNNLTWPLSYSQQSVLIRQILRYQPKGLFVDLLYTHDRSATGDSPQPLINVLERYGGRTPIYLPKVKNSAFSQDDLFAETRPVMVQWDGHEQYYPPQVDGVSTPAFELYAQYCQDTASCSAIPTSTAPPLAIQWGMDLSDAQDSLTDNNNCMRTNNALVMTSKILLSEVFWKLVPEWRQRCAYSITLPPDYLSATSSEEKAYLSSLLKDKFVMLGALIQGARDEVYSPVHGKIAGVYFHAMALDNLLTYGDAYFRPAPGIWNNIDLADVTDCVLFLIVLMWREKVSQHQTSRPEDKVSRRRIVFSALGLILILLAVVFVFSYWLNFQPINWVAHLILILSILTVKIRLFTPLKKAISHLKGYTKEKFV